MLTILRKNEFVTQVRQRSRRLAFAGLAFFILLTCFRWNSSAGSSRASTATLAGVIDLHCHSGPDAISRLLNDLDLARLARDAGMRALVLKNHFTMTADRANLAMSEVKGIEVFGGIVLNRAVGGLNIEAVRKMTEFEGARGKIVWLPSFDSEFHVKQRKEERPFVPVVKNGRPVGELKEIFQLIADKNLVLATGHSSPEESLILIKAAKNSSVQRILVTHIMNQGPTEDQLQRMAELGAKLECVFLTHVDGSGIMISDYARIIKRIGAEHFVISSDLGRSEYQAHTDGFRTFINGLLVEGISAGSIDTMARRNPAWLLGLDSEENPVHHKRTEIRR